MSSLTNVNNNASVVVVGRTAPVPSGQQPANNSIPVVLASDQPAIPVVEQDKIASEVALSLLGIPRSEVALGIFADVNTYDVNPTEWSSTPPIREELSAAADPAYDGFNGSQGYGLRHIPEESGALIEAPADKFAILTSKRFFRYQPGRVSAATFGVKTSIIGEAPNSGVDNPARNPVIRKYGIFDNFDGYYWETRDHGAGDQLVVVRRTQSIIVDNPKTYGTSEGQQGDDYEEAGEPPSSTNSSGTAGKLVILRDGLVHVHAAMYDPSLLKDQHDEPIQSINTSTNRITINKPSNADDTLENGQYITYYTTETPISGLTASKIYRVTNVNVPTSGSTYNFQLQQIGDDGQGGSLVNLTSSLSGDHYIRTPVPFIFPTVSVSGGQDTMFPYKRSFTVDYNTGSVTPVDTPIFDNLGIDTTANVGDIQTQIDTVNNAWSNWVGQNVKPEFYKVYEYRVPRSRFSGDFLNGVQADDTGADDLTNAIYYSDVVRTGSGDETIKKPGQPVINEASGNNTVVDSIWNIDFNKVIMQKIEFSWYGAVGALFLAYVPVSNGEARWVRVHHLRASNQLKVSSLGNATLPITYLVYGGGSENRFGYSNSERLESSVPGVSSFSQYITKYGASYYIDGGDRGTVRLYSYSSPVASEVKGSKYRVNVNTTNATDSSSDPYIILNESSPFDDNPVVSDYYMGATLLTGDAVDQGIKVTWVDAANKRLYLNKPIISTNIGSSELMDLVVDRPQIVYGVQSKTEIVSSQGKRVRNRVQVYPTRLTTGASGSNTVSVQLRKNPIFQTFDSYSGTTELSSDTVIQPAGQPTILPLSTPLPTIAVGDSVYGWFRGYLSSDDVEKRKFPVLGLLTRTFTNFTFTALDAYREEVQITGQFLKAGNYDEDGEVIITPPSLTELERLSSIQINNELRTPIPGTGTQVTTFYINDGGNIFDLSAYFDYNKDYLSYPLTNEIDSLFITASSVDHYINIDGSGNPTGSPVTRSSVLSSLTWEEQ